MNGTEALTIGDLVEVNPVVPVVPLALVRDGRATLSDDNYLCRLIDNYIVSEGSNAAAFDGLIKGLHYGGAFFVSGVYGSGKSHLLSVMGLIAESVTLRKRFTQSHPDWSAATGFLGEKEWFVVYCPLDEYDPGSSSLDQAIAEEVFREGQRQNISLPQHLANRADWMDSVLSFLRAKDKAGLVLLLDDLALYLNGRPADGFVRDASFLQFLAQVAARRPVTIVGVLQKGWENLHHSAAYAWDQVKDRFQQKWLLGLAHTGQMVSKVLLKKKDERTLASLVNGLRQQQPFLRSFSPEHLFTFYPLHPETVWCLERAAATFLSRARSVVTFIQEQVNQALSRPWNQLITPDAIVHHFREEMALQPDLRPYAARVIPHFEAVEQESGITGGTRLICGLLAFQLAGAEPTAERIAHALMEDPTEVWNKLERLRQEADFLVAGKRTGSPLDTYLLNPEVTATRALKRRLSQILASLKDEDPRLIAFATECRSENWLLPPPSQPRLITIAWRQTRRSVGITLQDLRTLRPETLLQMQRSMEEGTVPETIHLFLAFPLATREQKNHFEGLLKDLGKENRPTRVGAWIPREIQQAELLRWKENAALWILSYDRSLEESELGQAILARLHERLSEGKREMVQIVQHLYSAGQLVSVDRLGGAAEKTSPALTPNISLEELIGLASAILLDRIYPDFLAFAPRREASPQTYQALCRLLLKGLPKSEMTDAVKRWCELVAAPLRVCVRENDDWKVSVPHALLVRTILVRMRNEVSYRDAEGWLTEPPLGLTAEMASLVFAALLREGLLVAKNRSGQTVSPESLSVPLSASIVRFSSASVVDPQVWVSLKPFIALILGREMRESLTVADQQKVWRSLQEKAQEWRLLLQDIKPRLLQWWRDRGESPRTWSSSLEALQVVGELSQILLHSPTAEQALNQLQSWTAEHQITPQQLQETLHHFETLTDLVSHLSLLSDGFQYLEQADPAGLPDRLKQVYRWLKDLYRDGSQLLNHFNEWLQTFSSFRDAYAQAYVQRHEEVNGGEVFRCLQSLKQDRRVAFLTEFVFIEGIPESVRDVINKLDQTMALFCHESPLLLRASLEKSPFCPRCRMRLTDSDRADPKEMERSLEMASDELKKWLSRPEVRRHWQPIVQSRHRGDPLPQPEDDSSIWLSYASTIRLSLTAKGVITIPIQELVRLFSGRLLRAGELVQILQRWLVERGATSETYIHFFEDEQGGKSPDSKDVG
ncbi:MAG: DUF6079 family protein [Armatimonadetes bacterium]|nr:DUF6079 family protein [Armatimonadota bacterium]MDW8122909.1 DUF6079 family protein [Armatimonadota bacterium]